jgi:hypothetical protein
VVPCSLIKCTNILVGPAASSFAVKVEEWRWFFYLESGDSRFLKNTYHSTKLHSIISQKPIIFVWNTEIKYSFLSSVIKSDCSTSSGLPFLTCYLSLWLDWYSGNLNRIALRFPKFTSVTYIMKCLFSVCLLRLEKLN